MPKLSPFEGDLADLLIDRLNQIAMFDKKAMRDLIKARVPCNEHLAEHPSVQVQYEDGQGLVGILGILNGIVGAIPDGGLKGFGYISAVFDDQGNFERFRRTDGPPETLIEALDREVLKDLQAAIELPDPEKRGRIPDEPE